MATISEITSRYVNTAKTMGITAGSLGNTTGRMSASRASARNFAATARQADAASFSGKTLGNYTTTLKNINTTATNPVTGNSEATNQTVDTVQTNRLKSQISSMVSSYNQTLNGAGALNNKDVNTATAKVQTTANLQNIGVTQNKDGTLAFDAAKFDQNVKAGTTKLSDMQGTLTDLGALAGNVNKAGQAVGSAAATAGRETQTALAEQRSTAISQLGQSRTDMISSMLSNSSLGSNVSLLG